MSAARLRDTKSYQAGYQDAMREIATLLAEEVAEGRIDLRVYRIEGWVNSALHGIDRS